MVYILSLDFREEKADLSQAKDLLVKKEVKQHFDS
jgi:hypothetical protein